METLVAEPTSVGEMLREEFLKPLDITQEQLASAMGVSIKVVKEIIGNKRPLSLNEAVLLSGLLELDSDFWINVQANHDRWLAKRMFKNQSIKPLKSQTNSFPNRQRSQYSLEELLEGYDADHVGDDRAFLNLSDVGREQIND